MDLHAVFRSAVNTVPFLGAFAATAAAGLAIQVVVVVSSQRRLRGLEALRALALRGEWAPLSGVKIPSPWPGLAAAFVPVVIALGGAMSIQTSRGLILQTMLAPDASTTAATLSRGISGDMNATPMAVLLAGVAAVLACVAVGLAVAARSRARGLRHAASLASTAPDTASVWAKHPGWDAGALIGSALAFVALALLPLLTATCRAVIIRIEGYKVIASLAPRDKVTHLARVLDDGAHVLRTGLEGAHLGIALATIVAASLLISQSPIRARAHTLGPTAERSPAQPFAAVVLLALALIGFLLARPMQEENTLAWPSEGRSGPPWAKVQTPRLDGPDAVQRAPVLEVTRERTTLNGAEVDGGELHDRLVSMRNNYPLLHTDRGFDGEIALVAASDAPLDRVLHALAFASLAGFDHPRFIFFQTSTQQRPILGPIVYTRSTAAAVTAVWTGEEARAGATVVTARESATWAALATRVVKARRQGAPVALVVPVPVSASDEAEVRPNGR
jgi:hypothetical protein